MKTARLIAWTVLLATLALGPRKTQGAESKLEFRDFTVRTWGKADGLSDAPVTTILQARDGYLWVGTGAGLLSFDGVKFTDVGLRVPGTNGAVSVTALGEDRVGRLWVGSQQGLFCIGEGGVIHYGKVNGLLDEGITSLAIDAEGAVWIGTRHGANRWDGHHFTAFTTRDGLPDNWVSRIYAARSGAVWITTRWGMCFCADGRMSSFKFQMVGQWRSAEFLGVYEDLRRNLWAFATTYLIDLTEGKRFNYFRGQEPVSTRIWSLCESRDGTVWIGTSGRGLFGFDGTRFEPAIFSEGQGPNSDAHRDGIAPVDAWRGETAGAGTALAARDRRLEHAGERAPLLVDELEGEHVELLERRLTSTPCAGSYCARPEMLSSGIAIDESFVPSTTTWKRASSVPRYASPTRSFESPGRSHVTPKTGAYVATSWFSTRVPDPAGHVRRRDDGAGDLGERCEAEADPDPGTRRRHRDRRGPQATGPDCRAAGTAFSPDTARGPARSRPSACRTRARCRCGRGACPRTGAGYPPR